MQRLYDKLQTFSDHFFCQTNFVRWVFVTRSEYIANNYCKQCSWQHIRQIFAQRQLFRKGEHNLEFLSLKGGCTCSSESTLVKMSHCWKSHVTAQLFLHLISANAPIISTRFMGGSRGDHP